MATDYPGAVDTTSKLPNPTSVSLVTTVDHAGLHDNTNDAVKATQTKVGIGASTPVANTLLFGTGTGTSSWTALTSAQLLATISDETGTGSLVFATTPTLVTPKVDTINESTPTNGVTIDGLNIKDNALNTNNSVVTANITDSAVTSAKVATGFPVQVVSTNFSAVATGTTIVPYDDTIPQNTEGDQYMTQAITPKSAANTLVIHTKVACAISVQRNVVAALFQDATANALAVTAQLFDTVGFLYELNVIHTMTAGTTSATTFRVRVGPDAAATVTFNGGAGARLFGAITKSNITITEYKA